MHPIFLRLGPIEIRYYGLMYVISFVLGYFIVRAEARRRGVFSQPDDVLDLFLVVIPLGILFARLYYVAFQWDWYRSAPWEVFMIWHGGWQSMAGSSAAWWDSSSSPAGRGSRSGASRTRWFPPSSSGRCWAGSGTS